MTDNIDIEVDAEYTFNLEEVTSSDYKVSKHIVEWLKGNMENIEDKDGHKLFSKVNYGYNENTIKGFGKKPVCDVYINNITYGSDFAHNVPTTVNSFIICYLKGNMNNAYLKACELTDYLIQEFNDNEDFRGLSLTIDENVLNIVRDTFIRNVELQVIPGAKTYGVLSAFELEHELY